MKNTLKGSEAMVRMLQAHGVRHIFGLCGDTTLPFYDALYQLDPRHHPRVDPRRTLGLLYGGRLPPV